MAFRAPLKHNDVPIIAQSSTSNLPPLVDTSYRQWDDSSPSLHPNNHRCSFDLIQASYRPRKSACATPRIQQKGKCQEGTVNQKVYTGQRKHSPTRRSQFGGKVSWDVGGF